VIASRPTENHYQSLQKMTIKEAIEFAISQKLKQIQIQSEDADFHIKILVEKI